ncbi:unnamed protein product, partial [Allacma fusca]
MEDITGQKMQRMEE